MKMNNEQYNQIIDKVWKEYGRSHWSPPSNPNGNLLSDQLFSVKPMKHNKETFVNELKTNPNFAMKLGLKIEERELSLEERLHMVPNHKMIIEDVNSFANFEQKTVKDYLDELNEYIPTKLITITYKNKTIEVYE